MKLHYMGQYDQNPDSLPHGEHKENAVKFIEAENPAEINKKVSKITIILVAVFVTVLLYKYRNLPTAQWLVGVLLTAVGLVVHELLHAICFKGDVYLYNNLGQGQLFVVGPEDMSKARFVFMSLLPGIVLGVIPFVASMVLPDLGWLGVFGVLSLSTVGGDLYNVKNALGQMPKGARTYLHKFNSYWYMP